MANSDKNILITPNRNQASEPEISFAGFDNQPINLRVLNDNTISFQGSSGQLFSVSPNLTEGVIFSASDVSGIPGISLDADGIVQLAPFSGKVAVGFPIPKATLEVAGPDQAPGSAANTDTPEPTFRVTRYDGGDARYCVDFGTYQGGGYSWIRATTRNNLQAAHNLALQPIDTTTASVSIGQATADSNTRLHVKTYGNGASAVTAKFDSGTEFDATSSIMIRNRCSSYGRTRLYMYGRTQANNSAFSNPRNEILWYRSYSSTAGSPGSDTFAFRDGVELTNNVRFIGNSSNQVNFAINQSNKVYIGQTNNALPNFTNGGENWGGIDGSYQSRSQLLVTRGHFADGLWAPGVLTNFCTSRSWVTGSGSTTGHYEGNFGRNGNDGEQSRQWFDTPGHGRGIVWRCLNNDTGSNSDGGWNKYMYGVNPEKAYRSIVWVRRNSSTTSGTFYHGCDNGTTSYLSGNNANNPYFNCWGIGNLAQGVWYLSVGYIHAYSDNTTQTYGGIYDSRTGRKTRNYSSANGNCNSEYKWRGTGTYRQRQRVYLFYSTNPAADLEFWGPRFEEVNGEEPSVGALLGLNMVRPEYMEGLRVGGINNGTAAFSRTAREGSGLGSTDAVVYARDAANSDWGFKADKSNAGYGYASYVGSNANYSYGSYAVNLGDWRFRVHGNGRIYSDQSTSISTGADYAELFEWQDGNPNGEDRVGRTVSLVNEQIKFAEPGETPIGVISANPAVIGDTRDFYWAGKYQTDQWGRQIMNQVPAWKWKDPEDERIHEYNKDDVPEDVVVPEYAESTTLEYPVLNPDFDSSTDYVPRDERPEWGCVGLVGKLRIRKGQVIGDRWLKMRDINDEIEEWLVR